MKILLQPGGLRPRRDVFHSVFLWGIFHFYVYSLVVSCELVSPVYMGTGLGTVRVGGRPSAVLMPASASVQSRFTPPCSLFYVPAPGTEERAAVRNVFIFVFVLESALL